VAAGEMPPGIACDNCVAVHYQGVQIVEFISAKPEARAWRVDRTPEGSTEAEIVPRFLSP
jgi:hypothetical protein